MLEIHPLTRVEGHGSVKVHLEGSRVERVELCLTESPRLFEALLLGKSFAEVPEIVCRICSLCSTIHKIAALEAVEKALGVQVSQVTRLTRELMSHGGMLQDHALHLYCLVLPDLVGVPGVAELASHAPQLLQRGLAIKKVGNLIQESVGGRLIHPVNICPGGLGRRTDRDTLLRLKDELFAIFPACRATVRLFVETFGFPGLIAPDFLALETSPPALAGDVMRMSDGRSCSVERYREHVVETVLPHSHAKHARVLGKEPTVGALARLNLGMSLEPETSAIMESVKTEILGSDIRGNNLAQAIELCQAAERSLKVVDALLELEKEETGNVAVTPGPGGGAAAVEAPRGILIHSYSFDESGLCTAADVITPTSLNQGAISRDLLAVARAMEGAEADLLRSSMERLIRCYDPCISCSVHLLRI